MKSISIIEKTAAFIRVDGYPGAHISNVAAEAQQLAVTNNVPVRFEFNGVPIEVVAGEDAQAVVKRYQDETERSATEWRASDAGKQDAAKEAMHQAENQAKADEMLAELTAALASIDGTVAWVGEFSLISDQGAVYSKVDVIRQLEAAGYARNAFVGDPAVKTERNAFAQWVIGQVLDGLYHGGIHPIASKFAADYRVKFGNHATH